MCSSCLAKSKSCCSTAGSNCRSQRQTTKKIRCSSCHWPKSSFPVSLPNRNPMCLPKCCCKYCCCKHSAKWPNRSPSPIPSPLPNQKHWHPCSPRSIRSSKMLCPVCSRKCVCRLLSCESSLSCSRSEEHTSELQSPCNLV